MFWELLIAEFCISSHVFEGKHDINAMHHGVVSLIRMQYFLINGVKVLSLE